MKSPPNALDATSKSMISKFVVNDYTVCIADTARRRNKQIQRRNQSSPVFPCKFSSVSPRLSTASMLSFITSCASRSPSLSRSTLSLERGPPSPPAPPLLLPARGTYGSYLQLTGRRPLASQWGGNTKVTLLFNGNQEISALKSRFVSFEGKLTAVIHCEDLETKVVVLAEVVVVVVGESDSNCGPTRPEREAMLK